MVGEPGTQKRRRTRGVWVIGLLLALALILRLGYLAATPDYHIGYDAHDYDVHAQSIAQGHGMAPIGSARPARRHSGRPATATSSPASMR